MKWLKYYDDQNLKSGDDVFNYFMDTLKPSVTDWDYFVDWNKVFSNTRDIEALLNIMNYLLGKDDFDKEFMFLSKKYPDILKMIPVLIVRNGAKSSNYNVLTFDNSNLINENFEFNLTKVTEENIAKALDFIKRSGLIRIFLKNGVKNLVDYVLGVEAGLSSNGRKNRSGKSMENLCDMFFKDASYDYILQASPKDIKTHFNIEIKNNSSRKFDFVIKNKNKLYVIEVNTYSGGGSKLDKTASDYISLQKDLGTQATFIWITDGFGWKTTKVPLRKTFDNNDYIFNTHMITDGVLNYVFNN